MIKTRVVKIGILGLGTVGLGFLKAINKKQFIRELLALGLEVRVVTACVKTLEKKRDLGGLELSLTNDPFALVRNPDVDIVVELMGGTSPTKDLILEAINCGKNVVTANKAVIASFGEEIFTAVSRKKAQLGFEGAVAGGIPIIKILRESLVANEISSLEGIINGTTNFILSGMARSGKTFTEVLQEAQNLGFAEQDPAFDISGLDAAHKLTILSAMIFGISLETSRVYVEGIENVTFEDIKFAEKMGFKFKHLAIAKKEENKLELRVHPMLVPFNHALANVESEMNAIHLRGDLLGPMTLVGAGAGAGPTASAVVADLVDQVRGNQSTLRLNRGDESSNKIEIASIIDLESPRYIRVDVKNQPGMLALVTKTLAARKISIESIIQNESEFDDSVVSIVIITGIASEGQVQEVIKLMGDMSGIVGAIKHFRVQLFKNDTEIS